MVPAQSGEGEESLSTASGPFCSSVTSVPVWISLASLDLGLSKYHFTLVAPSAKLKERVRAFLAPTEACLEGSLELSETEMKKEGVDQAQMGRGS